MFSMNYCPDCQSVIIIMYSNKTRVILPPLLGQQNIKTVYRKTSAIRKSKFILIILHPPFWSGKLLRIIGYQANCNPTNACDVILEYKFVRTIFPPSFFSEANTTSTTMTQVWESCFMLPDLKVCTIIIGGEIPNQSFKLT